MKKTVDIDELKKRLHNSAMFNTSYPKWIESVIDGMPATNVYGEWIYLNTNDTLDPKMSCSVCGNEEILHQANFCPNCGAIMRK